LFPVYNQRLQRRNEMVALCVTAEPAPPEYLRSDAVDPGALEDLYGPFSTRQAARATLRRVATDAALCWTALGLDRRSGPCFARQLKKCGGACVGAETALEHQQRLRQALLPYALKPWPYRGAIAVREANMARERTDVHLFRDWCWLGTAHDEGEFGDMLGTARCVDLDVYRLLVRLCRDGRALSSGLAGPRTRSHESCAEQSAGRRCRTVSKVLTPSPPHNLPGQRLALLIKPLALSARNLLRICQSHPD
jgi:DNA polymerase-3 subunit epsilon